MILDIIEFELKIYGEEIYYLGNPTSGRNDLFDWKACLTTGQCYIKKWWFWIDLATSAHISSANKVVKISIVGLCATNDSYYDIVDHHHFCCSQSIEQSDKNCMLIARWSNASNRIKWYHDSGNVQSVCNAYYTFVVSMTSSSSKCMNEAHTVCRQHNKLLNSSINRLERITCFHSVCNSYS